MPLSTNPLTEVTARLKSRESSGKSETSSCYRHLSLLRLHLRNFRVHFRRFPMLEWNLHPSGLALRRAERLQGCIRRTPLSAGSETRQPSLLQPHSPQKVEESVSSVRTVGHESVNRRRIRLEKRAIRTRNKKTKHNNDSNNSNNNNNAENFVK